MSARNMEDIAEFMKTLRFKKTLIGGVSERDVWRKLDSLQKEYRAAYECQEERFTALLREREEEIAGLREQMAGNRILRENPLPGSRQSAGENASPPESGIGSPAGGAAHG